MCGPCWDLLLGKVSTRTRYVPDIHTVAFLWKQSYRGVWLIMGIGAGTQRGTQGPRCGIETWSRPFLPSTSASHLSKGLL